MNGVRYVETADILAGELAKLPPGAKLAGEHKIAGRFGVSRDVDSRQPVMCSTTWTRTDAVRIVVEMDDGTP